MPSTEARAATPAGFFGLNYEFKDITNGDVLMLKKSGATTVRWTMNWSNIEPSSGSWKWSAADKVIVPVQCEYLSMRGLIQLQNTLSMIRENLNPEVDIMGILPTMVDSRTLHAKEAIQILEENFGDRVFGARIRKTIRFAEAPVKGM